MKQAHIKREVTKALDEKLLRLFERKKRGDRKTDRHYVQVLQTRDELHNNHRKR
jgi:hypothetical protein